MKAIRVEELGGPAVLHLQDLPFAPQPGLGEALVRLEAIGVNYIDVYHRTGLYPVPLPFIPGSEGAGIVEQTGPGVTEVHPGDRVAFAMGMGTYAEMVVMPAWKLVEIPESVGSLHAASVMLQGMTAHYLTHTCYAVRRRDFVLIHAAAGGTGLLLVQIAKHLGAFVIGTTSSADKAKIVKDAGADEVILYTDRDFVEEVKRITGDQGVNAIFDSVGNATFVRGFDCLRPQGMMVLFGQSSGPVAPIDPQMLARKGSLFLTRPTLAHYTQTREELLERTGQVLGWVASGRLKIRIDSTYPLAEAAEAHRRLESRASSGKILLIP